MSGGAAPPAGRAAAALQAGHAAGICLAEVPVVIGYVRPAILMPVGLLAGLPADRLKPSCCTSWRTSAATIT